jgi:hypothetical protein
MQIGSSFTIPQAAALMAVSCIVSLSVFAINAKINASDLRNKLSIVQLELKIETEYIRPTFDSLLARITHIEEQLQGIYAVIGKRRTDKS